MAHAQGDDAVRAVMRHADIMVIERIRDIFHTGGPRSAILLGHAPDLCRRAMTGGTPERLNGA